MKIYLPINNKTTSIAGKRFFCCRLGVQFAKMNDVELINDSAIAHDVSLNLGKLERSNSKYKIIRLDGAYHNTSMNYENRNKKIAKNLHKSDGVVYQSNFGKRMIDKYLGKFKGNSAVILNGADPEFYKRTKPIEKNFEYIFLTSSKWRPHKRLRDIIESFLLASVKDSCLYVAGDLKKSALTSEEIKKYSSLSNVKFLGALQQDKLARYLVAANAFIHLCWTDCCPNGVVEAVCAKTIVICGNEGGTKEIVAPSGGFVCNIDKPYNLKPCELYSPPPINRGLVSQAINDSIGNPLIVSCDHVDIKNIAKLYKKFFSVVFGEQQECQIGRKNK